MTTTPVKDKRRHAYPPLERKRPHVPSHDPANLSPDEETLLFRDAESSAKLYMASLSDWYTSMIDHLINRKQLPSFYFLDAAKAAGLSKDVTKNWKIREWPNITPRNPQKIRDITQTLLLVMCRINGYPYGETYFEALARLQTRITELKDKYNQNALTELLNLPHNTIDNILTSTSRRHAKFVHCPWRLLEKLENAEERIQSANKMEMPEYGYLSNGPADRVTEEAVVMSSRIVQSRTIEMGGNCHRCRASWPSLRYHGPVEHQPDLAEFCCLICSSDNYVQTAPMERHSRCPVCNWPWWSMDRKDGPAKDQVTMVCRRCGMENRIVPKGAPPEGYQKLHKIYQAVDYDDETRHDP